MLLRMSELPSLRLNNSPLYVYALVSVSGQLGFFHFLAVVNNAAWGCEHACKTVLPVLWGIYAEKELLDCLVYI